MTNIKTFEDACASLGIEAMLPDVSMLSKADAKALLAHYQLTIIARALNAGWVPDWTDFSQLKYYPWFDMSSGSGLRYDDCDYRRSSSLVGSRLCFKSGELAEYAGNQFLSLYEDAFLIR